MNGAYEIGAIAMRSQQQALDTLANNVANMNTPTYRRSELQFSEIVASSPAMPIRPQASAMQSVQQGGVRFEQRDSLHEMGPLRNTGNSLDVAIDGLGFIEVMGPNGQTLLWRGGTLRVNKEGYLATASGYELLAGIMVPDDATEMSINAAGRVTIADESGDALEIGQLMIVNSEAISGLERLDDGLYRASEDYRLLEMIPGEEGGGSVMQGFLEGSNVDLTSEMVQLLMVQRAYAASAQVVQTADQLASITNSLKR